jgi:hypothetical protein
MTTPYTIKYGDTVTGIASKNGVSVAPSAGTIQLQKYGIPLMCGAGGAGWSSVVANTDFA